MKSCDIPPLSLPTHHFQTSLTTPKHHACAHVASWCSAGLSGYLEYANFRANFGGHVLSWRDFIAFLIDNFWGHPETLILVGCTSPSELEYSCGPGERVRKQSRNLAMSRTRGRPRPRRILRSQKTQQNLPISENFCL